MFILDINALHVTEPYNFYHNNYFSLMSFIVFLHLFKKLIMKLSTQLNNIES